MMRYTAIGLKKRNEWLCKKEVQARLQKNMKKKLKEDERVRKEMEKVRLKNIKEKAKIDKALRLKREQERKKKERIKLKEERAKKKIMIKVEKETKKIQLKEEKEKQKLQIKIEMERQKMQLKLEKKVEKMLGQGKLENIKEIIDSRLDSLSTFSDNKNAEAEDDSGNDTDTTVSYPLVDLPPLTIQIQRGATPENDHKSDRDKRDEDNSSRKSRTPSNDSRNSRSSSRSRRSSGSRSSSRSRRSSGSRSSSRSRRSRQSRSSSRSRRSNDNSSSSSVICISNDRSSPISISGDSDEDKSRPSNVTDNDNVTDISKVRQLLDERLATHGLDKETAASGFDWTNYRSRLTSHNSEKDEPKAGPSGFQAKAADGAGAKRKADVPPTPNRPPQKKARRESETSGSEDYDSDDDESDQDLVNKAMGGDGTYSENKIKVQIPNAFDDGEDEEYAAAETYDDYKPLKLNVGMPHPDPVVETASLASVEPTDVTYQLQLPQETVLEGKLSALQLEAVVYSAQAHEQTLPGGARAGFLIGDGAGVGKGRTVAGVIFENWLRGRRRAVWLSVSNDLRLDAERDLADIGAAHIRVHSLIDFKADVDLTKRSIVNEGVMFLTYTALSSKGRRRRGRGLDQDRVTQLVAWCGGKDFDGVIVLDECHRAKNLCPAGGKGKPKSTKTGINVLKLQDKLPKARLVYASATGATEPKNMAYMVRLGLWGEGTAFRDFWHFIEVVEKGGVGAMEIVAMDMKLRGMYIARQLSFRGVTFHIEEVPLTDATVKAYDDAVALWVRAKQEFANAMDIYSCNFDSLLPIARGAKPPKVRNLSKIMWAQFWGAHQRFFKYLCIATKVDRAVAIADEAVSGQQCAVIGLQSTGEARTLRQLEQHADELTELLSTAEGVFENLVEKQFPGAKYPLQDGPAASELKDKQNSLLASIKEFAAALPRNTLDELIDRLGGADKVAEMTGRRGRLVRTEQGVQYQSRCLGEATSLDSLNVAEKNRFMGGSKLVAVISEAASSGVSLQSDRRAANGRRRVHVTLELPWSADRAIQQFGRTHRSNQLTAPQYVFLISALAGERRFASVVAKRLESLGALTHGDRRAASDVRDLSHFNVDNKFGKRALAATLTAVWGGTQLVDLPPDFPDFREHAQQALEDVDFTQADQTDMTKFLNRILGMPVRLQNALFKYFMDNLDSVTEQAKVSGTFDQGIVDVRGARCVRTVRVLRAHATGHAPVLLHTVRVDRGMDWETAFRKYEDLSGTFYKSKTSFQRRRNILLYVAGNGSPQVYRPGTGLQRSEPLAELQRKNTKMTARNWRAEAKRLWTANHALSKDTCGHVFFRSCQPTCQFGRRERTYHVLAGSVLSVWDQLEFQRMQVVRVRSTNAGRVVGTLIHPSCVDEIEESLKEGAVSVETNVF